MPELHIHFCLFLYLSVCLILFHLPGIFSLLQQTHTEKQFQTRVGRRGKKLRPSAPAGKTGLSADARQPGQCDGPRAV